MYLFQYSKQTDRQIDGQSISTDLLWYAFSKKPIILKLQTVSIFIFIYVQQQQRSISSFIFGYRFD